MFLGAKLCVKINALLGSSCLFFPSVRSMCTRSVWSDPRWWCGDFNHPTIMVPIQISPVAFYPGQVLLPPSLIVFPTFWPLSVYLFARNDQGWFCSISGVAQTSLMMLLPSRVVQTLLMAHLCHPPLSLEHQQEGKPRTGLHYVYQSLVCMAPFNKGDYMSHYKKHSTDYFSL